VLGARQARELEHDSSCRDREVSTIPPFTPEIDELISEFVDRRGRKWTQMMRLADDLKENLGPLKGIPALLLKNRWTQLEINQRNMDFIAFNAGHFQLDHPEVMTIFPPDENDDEAAGAAVDEEDPLDEAYEGPNLGDETGAIDRPAGGEDSSDAEPVIGAAVVAVQPLGATPWLVFAAENRQSVKRANPRLANNEVTAKLSEMWRALSADEQAAYSAKAGPKPKPSARGRAATGRPRKK
jgi:hypothetical protein